MADFIHQMTDHELEQFVAEAEHDGLIRKFQQVEQLTQRVLAQWRARRDGGTWNPAPIYQTFTTTDLIQGHWNGFPVQTGNSFHRINVNLPNWLTEEEALFITRQSLFEQLDNIPS